MKKGIILSFFMLLMITSCINKKVNFEGIELITATEMRSILELEDIQLVDVRTSEEYDEKHIENAQNIDFRSPNFDKDISKLDKSKPVLVYCKKGVRSSKCAKKLKDAGFEKVYDLEGGLSKWEFSDILTIQKKS